MDASGQAVNGAGDGPAYDVTSSAPHPASQEFSAVPACTVVICRLDTPDLTDQVTGVVVIAGGIQSLGVLFAATDPEGKPVTSYQVYDANGSALMVNGTAGSATSAADAITTGSLSQVSLQVGAGARTDALYMRASNRAYWSDWTSLGVTSTAPPVPAAPPTPVPVPTPAASILAPPPSFAWTDTAIGAASTGSGAAYSGPVSHLRWQYLWAGQDSVNIAANVASVFLQGGSGDDELSAIAGSNVLDGGMGSNFLTGAMDTDGGAATFFLDGREDGSTWNILVNFHEGDAVTLCGFVPGQSTMS